MFLILTCNNCHKTSAVLGVIENIDFPRPETWLLWDCVRCKKHHRWLVLPGVSVEDIARQSLKNSLGYGKSGDREDVYKRLSEAPPEMHRKILFGELIWWWRAEVSGNLTMAEAAKAADIHVRQWIRIEAGESKPQQKNLIGIVHAVDGILNQAYLLTDSDKIWSKVMERRLADEEGRIFRNEIFQKAPDEPQLWESPDVEVALQALRKVLPYEFDEDLFLFYAHTVHQEYWGRQLGGPITIIDNRTEIIPVIKKLFNLFERSRTKQTQTHIVYLMARGAKLFMPRPRIVELVIRFISMTFISLAEEADTRRRIGPEWKQLSSLEKLALTLFDLIDRQHQSRFIKACQKIQGSAKGDDYLFLE